ncbi:MAG: site-specific integrase, partial [Bacilli bacterium]|nr:site-specific integrase [Bacilli bacterium]
MKLGRQIEEYLDYVIVEQNLTLNTKNSYQNELTKYMAFLVRRGVWNIEDVKYEDITEYLKSLNSQNLKPQSIAHSITAIRNFHKYFVKTGDLKQDVSKNIDHPKLQKQLPTTLSVQDVDCLLNIETVTPFDYRNKAMLELLYGTG